MEYLYHYTSIETLALILSNNTICFNNLLYVDDMEEAETSDMGKFGRFVYVSCWTSDDKESIPLWNLYTPDMHGVRIRLPKFPFKRYSYKKGDFFLSEDVETYINEEELYNENKISIAGLQPRLIPVEYTEDLKKLYPTVRTVSSPSEYEKYLQSGDLKRGGEINVSYSFSDIGKYKRKEWEFQKEWRYIITVTPMGLRELKQATTQTHQIIFNRIEDRKYTPSKSRLFLHLDEDILQNIEVLGGPKMSEAEKIIVKSLLKEYCPKGIFKESELRIRSK